MAEEPKPVSSLIAGMLFYLLSLQRLLPADTGKSSREFPRLRKFRFEAKVKQWKG
jgi:hypothetical protein